MSFICGVCRKHSKAGEKPIRVVIETREKIYPRRENANPNGNTDPGGIGIEIVKEILVCSSCQSNSANEWTAWSEKEKENDLPILPKPAMRLPSGENR